MEGSGAEKWRDLVLRWMRDLMGRSEGMRDLVVSGGMRDLVVRWRDEGSGGERWRDLVMRG